MSEIPDIPKKYLSNKYQASIETNYSEFADEGYWDMEYSEGWDWMGSSCGGGSRRFVNEDTTYGPCDHLLEELNNSIKYFKNKNERGVGRYKLYISIYRARGGNIDYTSIKHKFIIIIDNNRELDKFTYDVPHDHNQKMMNYNFED